MSFVGMTHELIELANDSSQVEFLAHCYNEPSRASSLHEPNWLNI